MPPTPGRGPVNEWLLVNSPYLFPEFFSIQAGLWDFTEAAAGELNGSASQGPGVQIWQDLV